MVLLDELYTISSRTLADGGGEFAVHLNADHFIYQAHFPGEPITPGVCILQMCVELLSEYVGRKLTLQCAKNVKYLKIIVPTQTPDLVVSIRKVQQENSESMGTITKAQIVVSSEAEPYTKLSLECADAR